MIGANGEDLNGDELHQRSLPVITAPSTAPYDSQVLQPQALISDHIQSRMFSNREIHTPDSLNNDAPLDIFHTQINDSALSQQRLKNNQIFKPENKSSVYLEEIKYNGTDSEKTEYSKDDIKRMTSSFDNSTRPVISGALTCSDVIVDEKRSCDSPKKQKRTESTPIVSGGVSSIDYVVPTRAVSDSPVMSRRKNESAPIVSGGATMMMEPEVEKTEIKSASSVKSAWVVDMSDCTGVTGKLPVEPRKQKKNESDSQIGDLKELSQNEIKAAPALGFFVDLKDTSHENHKPVPKEKKEINNEKDSKSHESSPARRNSGVGFFVDLKENTDKTVSSEGQELQTDETKSSHKNISCGFFVNLKENDQKKAIVEPVVECKKAHEIEVDRKTPISDKKNTIFSMFIDIGEPGSRQNTPTKQGSVESLRNKLSSPHLSTHKKLGFKNTTDANMDSDSKPTVGTVEESESPKSSSTCLDTNPLTTKSSKSTSQEDIEHKESKKQGFFMFIETESPVTRRKTLPSGLRPNLNRHSWNLEPRAGEQTDDQKTNGRRHHKRAHSLSVERGSVCTPSDDSKSSSTASLAKSRMRGSSQSLHEAVASPEQGSLVQMSSSYHSRLPSKSFERLPKRTLSYEGKSDSGKETPDIDTISEGKILGEGEDISKELDDHFPVTAESFDSSEKQENSAILDSKTDDEKELMISDQNRTVNDTGQENSCAENNTKDCETNKSLLDGKREVESKSLETSFVKLSDLDKEPAKTNVNSSESSDVLPSFAVANRMTRSIPETSWIESKLLMTRSIGGGTSSKSLSRLFPHLHTTVSATTSPSNIGRSKSPNTQQDVDDNDTQISETSDLSSMQSSMGPSGLEGSTEETDASSSYAGRSGPVSRLGEDLLRMFLEEINPDVTVEVGGRRLKAHKCILSSRCQYFAAILSGGWVESAGNVISLQGFSYNAVHFALCHIYSGTSNIPDSISIVELATLADMLGLEGLKEVIMYTLKVKYCHFFHKPCTMCAAGVLECLPLAAAYGLDDIYRKSLRWITKYFVRIWPTKGFASLPRELIEKCYQQHVVHMTVDNVLETVMCCDKLLATLPNVRWAEPVFGITSQLLESSIKFIANNFCGVLSSDSFLSLGKELSWNISRLEDSLMAATDRLPPDQACQSHTRLHNILTVTQSPDPPPEMQWSPNFVELLRRIEKRVEASLVRQAPRAARCPSWSQMELELRKKIQEAACLVLVPGEEGHKSRHASLARRGESGGSNSVYCTAPRSISSTGSRNLDIRQVKLAMTQQARRAASGGRVSTLRADTKSRSQSAKKCQQSSTHVPTHKADTVASQAKKVVTENAESTSRPKTWPLRVLEQILVHQAWEPPEKSGAMPRRTGKTMISSSDSSRTSSPAMRRSTSSGEGSGRGRAGTVGSSSNRNLLRRSETPPGKEVKSKKRKEGEVTMSTDSLSEPQSNGGGRRPTESITSRSCMLTRPDTPSVRRKLREEVAISTDSLAESVASGEKLPPKVEASASAPSCSLGSTRPDTPPVKERGRKCMGRLGVEVTMSTDSLVTTEHSFIGDSSSRKLEVNKIVPIPKSPTPKHQLINRHDGSKGNLAKQGKSGETRNESSQPRSPALAGRRVVMRQTIISPRDSPTFRLRSGVSSSPYTGSPSLRRSLLLAARSPTNDNAASVNNNTKTATPTKSTVTSTKTEKVVVKSFPSPTTSVTMSKRTPTRLQTRNQSVASPVKSNGAVPCRASGTPARGASKTNNNATRKVVSNGRNKQNNNEVSSQNKRSEPSEDRPLTVGSRSGTFLKDEPTILKKPDVDNVQE
ncbi:hypothetical protein L9F63_012475 [Diploptera punctata]|uniref:BTB domain-containing protein n=1 Tax=Diploptera punctata TaxID=6984 RepID=A0AAD8ADS8_DIPPU|nr:hypothetical protein L9F63_012475 [Diploptera punctata]